MRLFARTPPWYVAGLAFESQQCGRCCAGPGEGYVWVTAKEITAIAAHLGLSEGQMHRRHVRKVGRRFSLKECPGTRDCVFLESTAAGLAGCAIYAARPGQCRNWPFWASNLTDPRAWAAAQQRCRGINRGRLYRREDIEAQRDATGE